MIRHNVSLGNRKCFAGKELMTASRRKRFLTVSVSLKRRPKPAQGVLGMRRRLMALTLVALALPTAALANSSIDFKITPGTFSHGNFPVGFGITWAASMFSNVAANTIIRVTNLNLTQPCSPGATCTFTRGTVTVLARATHAVLFTSSLFDGTVSRTSDSSVSIIASLVDFPVWGRVRMMFTNAPGSNAMLSGSASVTTPEPATFFSLGTGLIGLAWMVRRKLK